MEEIYPGEECGGGEERAADHRGVCSYDGERSWGYLRKTETASTREKAQVG